MNQRFSGWTLLLVLCTGLSAGAQDPTPAPTSFKERVIDPIAISGPRPIDQDDVTARKYVKEMTWSLSADPAVSGTEDGIVLWNLAQQRQEKLNLQVVIDVSAYGDKTFSTEGEINQAYTYAFMSAYTAKLEGREPVVQRLRDADAKKDDKQEAGSRK